MKNACPDGLYGKHECGIVAVAICKACERAGSWNVMFTVPPRDDYERHVGFTWLILLGALRPVPTMSSHWVVTEDFLGVMKGRHALADGLGECHGLRLPTGAGLCEPEFGELQ